MTGADVVACARTYLGVRWRHQGASKAVAVDCIGLIGCVASECGLSDAWLSPASDRFKGYGRNPDPAQTYRACAEFLTPVTPWRSARPGDVLLMRFGKEPQHFAIVTATEPEFHIIHSYAMARRVVEHRLDDKWAARVVCAYRLPGL